MASAAKAKVKAKEPEVDALLIELALAQLELGGDGKSVEERLKDEQLDEYHEAQAAVASSEAGIETAAAQLAEAKAKVAKAKADLRAAQAQVLVALANLNMAKVFVQYTRIEAPYDGVVTFRGEAVHPGSFVRAADLGGGGEPLLTVAMTAKMRTIVPVPDRDAIVATRCRQFRMVKGDAGFFLAFGRPLRRLGGSEPASATVS